MFDFIINQSYFFKCDSLETWMTEVVEQGKPVCVRLFLMLEAL